MNKLASLQNRAIKFVTGGKYRDCVTPFYSQLNVLQMSDYWLNMKVPKLLTVAFIPIFPRYYRLSL